MLQELLPIALNPYKFERLPPRDQAGRFLLLSLLGGIALFVPGAALGLYLSRVQRGVEHALAGGYFVSLDRLFAVPAVYGLSIAGVGAYKSLVVYWPWLDQPGGLAKATRLTVAVVLFSAIGLLCLWLYLELLV